MGLLHTTYHIAKTLDQTSGRGFLRLINRIGTLTVGLGLAIILLAFMVFKGFERQVQERLFVFAPHLVILQYGTTENLSAAPIRADYQLVKTLESFDFVAYLRAYTFKNVLLQSSEAFTGIGLKGLDLKSLNSKLKAIIRVGKLPQKLQSRKYSSDILISTSMAKRLNLDTGQQVKVFFMGKTARMRKLNISGIYQSYIEEFDRNIAFCDRQFLDHLNDWGDSLVGGYEIYLKDFETLEKAYTTIYPYTHYDTRLIKVTDRASHYFEWFNLLNTNVYILLTVIGLVVFFNNMAVMSILIINMTQVIGLLKALGSRNRFVQSIFFFIGGRLVLKGFGYGNGLALGLGYLQHEFKWLKLDPQNYFLDTVPIIFDYSTILTVNLFMLIILFLTLFFSTLIITAIKPIKTLRFA